MKFAQEIRDFIRFTSTQPGEVWHVRHLWSSAGGWTVEWRCADRWIVLEAAIARKLARYLHAEFSRTFRNTPPERRQRHKEPEILAWVDALDTKGKEAMHNNRHHIHPPANEQVPA